MIKVEKSIYAPKEAWDGKRILVMTLWQRGVSKDKVEVWLKELGTPQRSHQTLEGGRGDPSGVQERVLGVA